MFSAGCGDYAGPVFVREKGQLRCVNSLESPACKAVSVRLGAELQWPRSERRNQHFIFTYTENGSLRYTAKSLLDLSLLFIAHNVEHVESLVGFPEQMADKLFALAEEKHKFAEPSSSVRALRLFSQAYGELLLKSLCLRERGLLLSERMEEIQEFHRLESLDLYGCRLGDSHEIFTHLTSEAFARLVRLFLGDNRISDKGLQRLTAPIRFMKKKGLESLQRLDLSCNPLTEKGLGFLTCFKKLRELNISQTEVKLDASLRGLMRQKMGMLLSDTPLKAFAHSDCRTEGWAEEVINQWEMKASELPKKEPKAKSGAPRFYGREKFVREQMLLVCNDHKSEVETPALHFYKPDPSSTSRFQADGVDDRTKRSTSTGKKRSLCLEGEEEEEEEEEAECPPTKRRHSHFSHFSAEDLELLNRY